MNRTYNAPKTSCNFDNLRDIMSLAYNQATHDGEYLTHIRSGYQALTGYEYLTHARESPITYFKGLPVIVNPNMPRDEMRFMQDGRIVAVIQHIS